MVKYWKLSVFDQSLNLTEDVLKENVRRKSNESKCLELEELVLIALNQTLDIQANCRLAKDIKSMKKMLIAISVLRKMMKYGWDMKIYMK